jgi:hypothetical protein
MADAFLGCTATIHLLDVLVIVHLLSSNAMSAKIGVQITKHSMNC